MRKSKITWLALAVVGTLLSACSSDDASESTSAAVSSAATAETTAPTTDDSTSATVAETTPAETTPAETNPPVPPTGKPLVFAAQGETLIGGTDLSLAMLGMEAWAKQVNARGGLFGRPVEIRRCDFKLDAGAATTCVQDAIADPDVLAFAGGTSSLQPVVQAPAAEGAGMLILPAEGVSPAMGTMPTGFLGCNSTGPLLTGVPRYLVEKAGLTKVASIRADLEATAPNAQQVKETVEAAGGEFVGDVKVPLTATDLLPAVTEAAGAGAEVVVLSLSNTGFIGVANAIRDSGLAGKMAMVLPGVVAGDPAVAAAVKDSGVDAYYGTETDVLRDDGATHADYVEAMTLNGSTADITSAHAGCAYQAGLSLQAILEKAGPDPTRQSILDAAMSGTFDVDGYVAPLERGVVAAFPALAINDIQVYNYATDELVSSDLVPVFTAG